MADGRPTIDAIIAGVRLPERIVTLCLRGDLQAEWEQLERQLQRARLAEGDSLAGRSQPVRGLAEQMDAIGAEMRAHEVTFQFRALSARAYSDLLAKHKRPKEEQTDDDPGAVNLDTFPAAIISACCVEPEMSLEQAENLCDAITDKQWDDLYTGAVAVNRASVIVPPTLSSSAIRAVTEPKSKPPEPGESADADSSAGSLAG